MTQYTEQEIEKRKAESLEKRAKQKADAAAIRAADKEIMHKMHENRGKMLFSFPINGVTCVAFKHLDDPEDVVTVFWTVRHQGEQESFRIAKKYLGRYMSESRKDRFFKITVPRMSDPYVLTHFVNYNFFLKAISKEIQVPKWVRSQIKWMTPFEVF